MNKKIKSLQGIFHFFFWYNAGVQATKCIFILYFHVLEPAAKIVRQRFFFVILQQIIRRFNFILSVYWLFKHLIESQIEVY